MSAKDRVWPGARTGLKVERFTPINPETGERKNGTNVVGMVNFRTDDAALTLCLLTENKFAWSFNSGEETYAGGGVHWSHGRLVCAGKDGVTCFQLIRERMGLTFGQVEAEFREITGYKDA